MENRALKQILLKEQWCKACSICIAFCPRQALTANSEGKPVWNGDLCIRCSLCEQRCPDFAIYLGEVEV
ncbi:MAG: 4Fe-4S binding protein [Symbiobacteriaceae bacterium]|nr:4Fe-4S binding protein [Symbiobacteriaceae bacterium]